MLPGGHRPRRLCEHIGPIGARTRAEARWHRDCSCVVPGGWHERLRRKGAGLGTGRRVGGPPSWHQRDVTRALARHVASGEPPARLLPLFEGQLAAALGADWVRAGALWREPRALVLPRRRAGSAAGRSLSTTCSSKWDSPDGLSTRGMPRCSRRRPICWHWHSRPTVATPERQRLPGPPPAPRRSSVRAR